MESSNLDQDMRNMAIDDARDAAELFKEFWGGSQVDEDFTNENVQLEEMAYESMSSQAREEEEQSSPKFKVFRPHSGKGQSRTGGGRHAFACPLWRAKDVILSQLLEIQQDRSRMLLEETELVRIEVRICSFDVEDAMLWLRSQHEFPKVFFLNPERSHIAAGVGSAHLVSGEGDLQRHLLPEGTPACFRYYGGSRFDAGARVGKEWQEFGGHYFVLPQIEIFYSNCANAQDATKSLGEVRRHANSITDEFIIGVNVRRREDGDWVEPLVKAISAVKQMNVVLSEERDLPKPSSMKDGSSYEHWKSSIESALEELKKGAELRKVVLSRNFFVEFSTEVEPMDLLLKLKYHQGYLFCLQPTPGSAFLGCSPEPLFKISHDIIETMAISGTRPRGQSAEQDEELAKELLASEKDKYENGVTTKYIQEQLANVAEDVETSEIYVMKLRHVQHICRKIRAKPSSKAATPIELLLTLNPTPAVCGESRPVATRFIRSVEGFDRGFFGGPVGFVSSSVCEFLVAIRSVLCKPKMLHVYAGAGIVPGSDPKSEWEETAFKMRNILQLFANPPRPLSSLPNINMLWAVLTVEELCRCGVTVFCLCPGSRSTPLAVAVSWNAKATSVVMHDERSAGFYCVGYARAKRKPAACIVTSGTAVANLLPAAVEASQQGLPMLLLTADRPFELRDNGSNQTIEQAGIFGRYVRWSRDLCCPSDQIPANVLLSDVDFAVHRASSSPRGPVHLNFQFRENLAPDGGPVRDNPPGNPISSTWSRACIASLNMAKWEHSALPHTLYPSSSSHVEVPAEVLSSMARARRGLVVVGNLFTAEDMATVGWVAAELCWPVWCDAQSGGRWDFGPFGMRGVSMMDQMLTNQRVSGALRPDFILQFGERLVSKRILSLISSCCYSDRCSYVVVSDAPGRQDPSAIVTHYLSCSPTDFGKQLSRWMQHNRIYPSDLLPLEKMSEHARTALWSSLSGYKDLEEPLIALRCSESLARGRALFVSSSMPIRDVDMFFHAALSRERPEIGCNRGASGIDGIVSSALGYAGGRGRPLTLLLGDTAALYDLSAIRHVPDCPHPVVLVIVNNGGCGIFRFLPIAQHEEMMEKFFINSHQIDFESLARSFGIDYMHAATAAEFDSCLHHAETSGKHVLLEARTSSDRLVQVHRDIAAAVSYSVDLFLEHFIQTSWIWHGDRDKPVLLLLHGFLGCKEDWDPLVPALLQDGTCSCLAVDLPGHGDFAWKQGGMSSQLALSWEVSCFLLDMLLQRLGVSSCVLVGYSMGGRLALNFALKHPARVKSMCILSAHPGLESSEERFQRVWADRARADELRRLVEEEEEEEEEGMGRVKQEEWRRWLMEWYGQSLFGEIVKSEKFPKILERRRRGNPKHLAEVMENCSVGRLSSAWNLFENSGAPILYLYGERDTKFAALADKLRARSGSHVLVHAIQGCSHAIVEEQPDATAREIVRFLSTDSLPTTVGSSDCDNLMIASVQVRRMDVKLKDPLQLSRGDAMTLRKGFLIECISMGGHVGVGECTPLPGFHEQTYEEVERQILDACKCLCGRIVPRAIANFDGSFTRWLFGEISDVEKFAQWHFDVSQVGRQLPAESISPVVLAALEMALVQLVSHALERPLCRVLSPPSSGHSKLRSFVSLNGLMTRGEVELPRSCSSRVVKVKVGGKEDVKKEAEELRDLVKKAKEEGWKLRLDANRCWDLEQAVQFVSSIGFDNLSVIEYIEEPLTDFRQLPRFFQQTGLSYALDESLLDDSWEELAQDAGLAALVLKPTLLGGLERCCQLKLRAREGVKAVLSSAFESGLAHCFYGIAAGVLLDVEEAHAHGLSTFERLETDSLTVPMSQTMWNGRIDIFKCEQELFSIKGNLKKFDLISD